MFGGETLDSFVNVCAQCLLPRRKMDQGLSAFECLQDTENIAIVLREIRDCGLVDHGEPLRAVFRLVTEERIQLFDGNISSFLVYDEVHELPRAASVVFVPEI